MPSGGSPTLCGCRSVPSSGPSIGDVWVRSRQPNCSTLDTVADLLTPIVASTQSSWDLPNPCDFEMRNCDVRPISVMRQSCVSQSQSFAVDSDDNSHGFDRIPCRYVSGQECSRSRFVVVRSALFWRELGSSCAQLFAVFRSYLRTNCPCPSCRPA